jgi:hypothetical protein
MIFPSISDIASVLIMLAFAGVVYDRFVVDIIEKQHPPLGVTAWEVVGGVLFTLVGFAMLAGFEAFLLAVLCFAASGIPMILGARARHMEREEAR